MPIIQGLVLEGSTIHSDGWNSYDGLILNGYDHNRVFHSENEFARGKCHVNGIENFWSFLKRRLPSSTVVIQTNRDTLDGVCEWRYNHCDDDLYKELTKILKRY